MDIFLFNQNGMAAKITLNALQRIQRHCDNSIGWYVNRITSDSYPFYCYVRHSVNNHHWWVAVNALISGAPFIHNRNFLAYFVACIAILVVEWKIICCWFSSHMYAFNLFIWFWRQWSASIPITFSSISHLNIEIVQYALIHDCCFQ